MKKLVVVFMMLLWLLPLSVQIVAAQTPDVPLIITRGGNLFALYDDGREQQLTDRSEARLASASLDRGDVLMSPNGRYLAYADIVEFYAEAWINGSIGNINAFLRDIYIIDLTTGRPLQVTRQPQGTTPETGNQFIFHALLGGRTAIWSPDGTQLAFTERRGVCDDAPDAPFCYRVVIFDATTGESRVIAEDEPTRDTPRLWTENGLILGHSLVDPADGTVLASNYYNSGYVPRYALQIEVENQVREYLIGEVLGFPNTEHTRWYLFDIQTGEYLRATGYLSVVSAAARDTSLLLVGYDNDTRPGAVFDIQGNRIAIPPQGPPYAVDYMVSHEGTQYAYSLTTGGAVVGDANGTETPLSVAGEVVAWGTPVYTLFNPGQPVVLEPTLDPYTPESCGTLPAISLTPGGEGRVLPGSPNRIRSIPRIEGEPIGSIPAEATFTVVDGQQGVCANGIRWAQVEYDGVTGWTAQGVDGDVFLEPVN